MSGAAQAGAAPSGGAPLDIKPILGGQVASIVPTRRAGGQILGHRAAVGDEDRSADEESAQGQPVTRDACFRSNQGRPIMTESGSAYC
ncbi:MAG: hypothetical protein DMH00_13050 [Acidobacteria bacterium]|nr:MAG: hypothetical protein DMH00_13050 [Acidobacteriota bacterium]